MSTTFESLMMLEGLEAQRILQRIDEEGAGQVLAALRRECDLGTGTLISVRIEPWSAADFVYEDNGLVMYWDRSVPSVGLAWVMDAEVSGT